MQDLELNFAWKQKNPPDLDEVLKAAGSGSSAPHLVSKSEISFKNTPVWRNGELGSGEGFG